MREILKTSESIRIPIFLIKNNPASETRGKTALSGNTEFLRKLGSDDS
jgi:hypothetical protein